ncbi:putative RNA helicase [Mycoemilia scoparia]|uniref:RNA helicase n=1 Tax=Mycoemilia scoparia TaxID=417184 RepID=A0A9W8DU52_9FUNG|nr:putative RNA helicase [Mycoemilia scoparia]
MGKRSKRDDALTESDNESIASVESTTSNSSSGSNSTQNSVNASSNATKNSQKSGSSEKDHESGPSSNSIISTTQPSKPPPMCSFSDLRLDPWLVSALNAMSITQPTEIQRACVKPILEGRDVIGGAKTGSGKTAAFALPILQKLSIDPYGVYAIVLTPTRELAFQIADQFNVLGKSINLKVAVVVGGLDMTRQALELSKRPHIIIATPGRLADHINSNSNAIFFKRLKFLVMDEADRLLTPPFGPDLSVIMNEIPRERQTLLFTATMTDSILALKNKKEDSKNASDESVGGSNSTKPKQSPFVHLCDTSISTVSTLIQNYIFVPSHVKEAYLANLLRDEKHRDKSTLIFVGQCKAAESLRVLLRELGFRVTALHSKMSQQERLNSLGKFKAEVIKILIATDVASRGLDIPTVGLVVNLHVPRDPDDYIHRVGRTARAGRGGQSVTIMSEGDIRLIHNIEDKVGKKLEEYPVNENEVLEILPKVVTAKRVAALKSVVWASLPRVGGFDDDPREGSQNKLGDLAGRDSGSGVAVLHTPRFYLAGTNGNKPSWNKHSIARCGSAISKVRNSSLHRSQPSLETRISEKSGSYCSSSSKIIEEYMGL